MTGMCYLLPAKVTLSFPTPAHRERCGRVAAAAAMAMGAWRTPLGREWAVWRRPICRRATIPAVLPQRPGGGRRRFARGAASTTAWDATCSTPATRGKMVLVVASRRVPATVSWRRRVLGPAPRRCGGARSSTASGRARRRARRDAGGARRQARRDDDEGGSAWHAGDRGARRRATGTQEACCDATGRDGRRLRQVSCFFFRRHCSLTPLQLRYLAAKREARRRRGRLSAGQRRGGRLAVARMRGGGLSTAPRGPGRRQARQNWGGNGG